jgi:uncharacterized membrane protein YhaH (DUF805 family)
MELLAKYFLCHGRINRRTWLARVIALGLVSLAFGMLADAMLGDPGAAVFALAFTWGALAVSAQRLHDIGRTGAGLLLLLIPVLGPLWVLLLLGRRGGEGKNRYGDDPLSRHDYLQVNIAK